MSDPHKKARQVLKTIRSVFEQNEKLKDNLLAYFAANRDDEARPLARKILHTYEVLEKHERLLLNEEARDGLGEFERAQKAQLYDLELLERAIRFLDSHPDAVDKVRKGVAAEEREFLYSLKDELDALKR